MEGTKTTKDVDGIQQRLTEYASGLSYDRLTPEAVHAAKAHVIDTLGALVAGFFGEALYIAREVAMQMPDPNGATVIGTRWKTTPDMAAFVNASAPHYPEMQDVYHWPSGVLVAHPSDTVTPVLAAAEHVQAGGRDFLTGVVLAYELFCRICDNFHNPNFDYTNFSCLGSAIGAAKMFKLTPEQLSHCISMAVVPNVALRQAKESHMSMWKEMASGQAGRAGVFAAMLARAGMEGPHLPFEGKAGWCDHVALERFKLGAMGGEGERFKILDALIKNRPAAGSTICTILAAEKIGPVGSTSAVKRITVEVYKRVHDNTYTSNRLWNPDTRGIANHSFPYCVAAALMDGRVTTRSFNDEHLSNPHLRDLIRKMEIVVNPEFAEAYERVPQEHRAKVTVFTENGETLVGESGGDEDDLARPKSDAVISAKFRELTEDYLGAKRVSAVLDRLWHLEEIEDIAQIPAALVLC